MAIGAVLALVTLPALRVLPGNGVDFSWASALHIAAERRLRYGSQVVFTYGPLGFLSLPIPYFGVTWALSVAYVVGLQLAACTALLSAFRRSLALPAAAAAAFVVATVGRVLGPTELVVAVFVLVALLALDPDHFKAERAGLLIGAGGAVAGVHLLVKFNTGLSMLLVGAVVTWVVGRGRWRSEAVFGAAAVGSMLAGWLVTGNRLVDLGLFFKRSLQVASGFSEAMGSDDISKAWEYLLAAGVVALLAGGAWLASRQNTISRRLATGVVVAIWLFVAGKHGFVRHDTHSIVFFGEACFIAVAFCRTKSERTTTLAIVGALLLSALVIQRSIPPLLVDPRFDPGAGVSLVADVVRGDPLTQAISEARARQRASYGLDAGTLAALAGRTVLVYPNEASLAWAYPELAWQPLPVIQAYSAYTKDLDELNAAAVSAADSPERILNAGETIDGRNADWESPATMRAMACHYSEIAVDGRWQILARVADRCAEEQHLATVLASLGEVVPVPDPGGPDRMVVARINGLDATPLYRLRAQLLKTPSVTVTVDGATTYRIVPGTAGDGMVLSAPEDEVGWSRPFAFAPAAHTLEARADGWGVGDRLRIEFSAVPIRATA